MTYAESATSSEQGVEQERVGIRELRDHLSQYLDRVEDGDGFVVTDRGRPVARLEPYLHQSPLERLIAEGRAQPPRAPFQVPEPVPGTGTVSDLVAEQRR